MLNKILINLKIIELLLIFFTGFFGLSSLSIVITRFVGIPYFIEFFFLPLIAFYFYRKKVFLKSKYSFSFYFLFFFFIFFIFSSTLIGIINTNNVIDVVTTIRPFLYLVVLVFYFSSNYVKVNLTNIYYLSFGTLVGELFYKIIIVGDISDIDHINTIALCMFILIPFIQHKKILIFFSSLFGIAIAFTTLYRRIILFAIVAILVGIIYTIFRTKPSKRIPIISFSIISTIFLFFNYVSVIEFIINILSLNGNNNFYLSASYRLITKLTTFDSASDVVRISVIQEIFTEFHNKILPIGPIGKFMGLDYFGAYTDTTNVFLYDVFGSIISLVLVILLLLHSLKIFFKVLFLNIKDQNVILSGLMVPILALFIFLDGTFLVHANISIPASLAFFGLFKRFSIDKKYE